MPATAGLVLLASTAAASPLSAAVGQAYLSPAQATPVPKHAIIEPGRTANPRAVALEGVRYALSRVADGSTYVWHHKSGVLSGSVKPTASFRKPNGQLCRHVEMELSLGASTRAVEGIACRQPDGIWSLEG